MPFEWTNQSEEAAQLVADGRLTNTEIAERLGIDRKTLYTWRKDLYFAARVADLQATFQEETERLGISQRAIRLRALNDVWQRMYRLLEARAEATGTEVTEGEPVDVPGGSTGLLVRTERRLGGGEHYRDIVEFTIDPTLLKEFREYQKQAAIERGQWTEKHKIDLSGLTDAQLLARATGAVGGSGTPGPDSPSE